MDIVNSKQRTKNSKLIPRRLQHPRWLTIIILCISVHSVVKIGNTLDKIGSTMDNFGYVWDNFGNVSDKFWSTKTAKLLIFSLKSNVLLLFKKIGDNPRNLRLLFLTNKPNFQISLTTFNSLLKNRLAKFIGIYIKEMLKKQTQFKAIFLNRQQRSAIDGFTYVPKGTLATDSENTHYLSTASDSHLDSAACSRPGHWLTASSSSRHSRGLWGRGWFLSSGRRRRECSRPRRFRWRTIGRFDCVCKWISFFSL